MSAAPGTRPRREGLVLGSVRGTPIILANSWYLIAGFTVLVFGPQLQNGYPGLGAGAYLVAFAYAVLLLFSVLVHELAHALAAKMYGWPTHKIVLNLWGGHTEFDFSTATPGRALVVAFAGPVGNFVLAAAAYPLMLSLQMPTSRAGAIALLLTNIFLWANVLIGAFNVLPGLPLDGGRLVESIVWKATGNQEKGTVAAGWAGRVIVVLLVVGALGLPYLQGSQPDLTNTFIVVLLAGFLWMGASASIKGAAIRLRLPAITASRLAAPAVSASIDCSVAQLWSLRGQYPGVPIVLCSADGRPAAVVDEHALANVPPNLAGHTLAPAVARSLTSGAHVPETASGAELVQYLSQLPDKDYAVVNDQGRVTGLLSQARVVAAITGK
ncbi:Zn-dependent protease [Arthrobacter silviterrae]|uniref:Zinc metalloprotease n=1 Tax=Arthrobacter silviterrae TaxID=2026658 RepID=A0ABX0D707_9MICC|nr:MULTISPECIES: site-2 protease family protein [Arthrobacter]MCU6480208.1 site-2 protease family protein [Arthrobacter sp. A2-55]MDQ0276192.1 Zn-dependent protease [Arthrobacter silviterrae]NGN82657.1 site-2 protease family protein [Arthrobacter silviterrae]